MLAPCGESLGKSNFAQRRSIRIYPGWAKEEGGAFSIESQGFESTVSVAALGRLSRRRGGRIGLLTARFTCHFRGHETPACSQPSRPGCRQYCRGSAAPIVEMLIYASVDRAP